MVSRVWRKLSEAAPPSSSAVVQLEPGIFLFVLPSPSRAHCEVHACHLRLL